MIVRAKRNTNYTIMSNVGLNDSRLSLKAKGMLAHLLSKPDNWQVSDRQLATIGPDGRAAVQAALKELEIHGYLQRTKVRNDGGTFSWQSTIYDEPWFGYPATDNQQPQPWLGLPATVQPATVEPATDNRAKISTVLVSTDKQILKEETAAAEAAPAAAVDPDLAMVWESWTANMPGTKSPVITEGVNELLKEYSAAEIVEAIAIACRQHKRSLSYVQGILAKGAFSSAPQPKLSEVERNKIVTRAKNARSSIRTAEQFNGRIDPQWLQDIEVAKGHGLI